MAIIQQYFIFDIAPAAWVALALAFVCGLVLAVFFRGRISAVRRRVTADDEEPMPVDGYPAVSVIVYSQSDGYNLRTLLVQILEQDYPAPMEVIVVNDENADSTEDVVSELEMRYRNLYMTFAPERSRNLSRKKLSITLGLKAARYDAVVLTCGNCRVESPIWLRLMMRHFIDGKEVVLGQAVSAVVDDDGALGVARLSRRDTFDVQWDAVRSFGAAVTGGRPFMGDGCNLAYSKRLFFANKGFSKTLDLNFGDDDIFISEVASKANTAVELAPDARVMAVEGNPSYMHGVYKTRRMFTAGFLPRGAYRYMGAMSLLSWLFLLSCVAAVMLSLPSLVPALAVAVLVPAVCLPVMVAWRRAGRALGLGRQAFLTQPAMMLWHPFYNMKYKMRARKTVRDNYTWGQKL